MWEFEHVWIQICCQATQAMWWETFACRCCIIRPEYISTNSQDSQERLSWQLAKRPHDSQERLSYISRIDWVESQDNDWHKYHERQNNLFMYQVFYNGEKEATCYNGWIKQVASFGGEMTPVWVWHYNCLSKLLCPIARGTPPKTRSWNGAL